MQKSICTHCCNISKNHMGVILIFTLCSAICLACYGMAWYWTVIKTFDNNNNDRSCTILNGKLTMLELLNIY